MTYRCAYPLSYLVLVLYAVSSREVTLFRYYGHETTGYAICPGCGNALEREYQKHCDRCGQLLGWNRFRRDEITVQRVAGKGYRQKDAFHDP